MINPQFDDSACTVATESVSIVQESLEKLSQDRTTFVIAHRLSTIKNADQIIVMDQGHIVEIGNHEELLQKQGYYHQLYYSQFEQK